MILRYRSVVINPILLDGKKLASELNEKLKQDVSLFKNNYNLSPRLAIIMIGDDPSCMKYTRLKQQAAECLGISCTNIDLPAYSSTEEVLRKINALNNTSYVHGIMIQHPIPEHLSLYERRFFDEIDPLKDVDGLTSTSFSRLSLYPHATTGFQPATPKGILKLLDHYNVMIAGKTVTVVGSSQIVGLPLAMLLHHRGATIFICNKFTDHVQLTVALGYSDIIIGACGVEGLINGNMVPKGAVLVDVGCSPSTGGVFTADALEKSSYFTPPIGGVGPMTVSTLLSQTVQAAKRAKSYEEYRGRYLDPLG